MAQLERPQRPVNTSKTPPPTIHTMEQLLRAGEGSKLSPTYSPSSSSSSPSSPHSPYFMKLKHHDMEEGQNQKKSVLTKVKEKAKKLRHSLSKKKHEDGNITSPSWRGLQDDGVEEDAEYLGAPMYESEKAPQGYKENARQHPRGSPVTAEKHALSSKDKARVEQDREKSLGHTMSKRTTQPATATDTKTVAAATTTTTLPGANKTVTKTVAEKLTPSNAEGSDAAHSITSKIPGLAVSKPAEQHHTSSSTATTPNTSLSIAAPKTPPAKMHSQASSSSAPRTSSAPVTPRTSSTPVTTPTSSSSAPATGKNTSPTAQLWDKGVSVKEYLMNKFEPGEDEKALSQVISEAMSPRRTPGDAGVMEKVREAVTSLLRNEEPKKYADTTTTRTSSQTPVSSTNNTARASSQTPVSTNSTARASSQTPVSTNNTARASSHTRPSSQTPVSANNTTRPSSQTPVSTNNTTRASSQIPVSTNAQEAVQEENHGRILQAN